MKNKEQRRVKDWKGKIRQKYVLNKSCQTENFAIPSVGYVNIISFILYPFFKIFKKSVIGILWNSKIIS